MSEKEPEATAVAIKSPAIGQTALATVGSGALNHNVLNNMIRQAGGDVEFVGGSLPPINFAREGDAYILEFIGRDEPIEGDEKRDFALLLFWVLDPKSYIQECKPREGCRLHKGSITEQWAFERNFGQDVANSALGKVYKVTYTGQAKKKSETRNAANLYSIEVMRLPQRATIDAEQSEPKGKKK